MKHQPENPELYSITDKEYTCILAETEFFKTGENYRIYLKEDDPEGEYVKGSDGLFDRIGMTVSRFRKPK